jgi:hypothetical protein
VAGGYTDGDEVVGWAPVKVCKDCGQEKPLADFYKSGKYFQPRCKPCHSKKTIAWMKANPKSRDATTRKVRLKKKYGLTVEAYEAMEAAQGGKCFLCGNEHKRRKLNVDHCHTTGRVRGLLCDKCNLAIGLLEDNPMLAEKFKEYLAA